MTLKEKLLNKFIESTKSVKNKREIEWSLNDLLQIVLIVLVIIGVVCTINFNGWGLVIFYLIYALLLWGYMAMAHAARVFILNILYPEDFDIKENEETQLNNLFTQIDTLIKELND